MSSINQLVSQIAHSIQQPDSVPVRRAIKLNIIQVRNDLIRKSFNNHKYIDKGLQQRIRISLQQVPEGDINIDNFDGCDQILRSVNKVPKPIRLTNNLPFHSIRTVGTVYNTEIPFIRQTSAKYFNSLIGMSNNASYDYINGYIYINLNNDDRLLELKDIVIESVFELPQPVEIALGDFDNVIIDTNDDDEYFISEDMVVVITTTVLQIMNANVIRDTNEIPTNSLTK